MRASDFEFRYRFWIMTALFYGSSLVAPNWAVFEVVNRRMNAPLGTALCLLCFFLVAALRTWAAAYLRPEVIHSKKLESDALVADGPFRHVRNPLYLGTVLLGAGFGLLYSVAGFAVIVGSLALLSLRLILREEAELTQSQGESYRAYLREVPRLIPSFTPRLPPGDTDANWSKAFRGELMFWLFLINILAFFTVGTALPAKLRVQFLEIGIVTALAMHLLVQPRRRRKR